MRAAPEPAAGTSPWSTRTAGAPCTATCDRTRGAWESPRDFGSPRWAWSGKSGAPATRRARICISRSSIIGERRGTRSWRSTRRRKPCACSSGWGWRNDRARPNGPESPRPPPPARGRGRRRRRARGLGRHRARLASLAGRWRAGPAGGGDLRRRSGGLSRSAARPAVGFSGGGGDGGIRGPRLLPAAAVGPPLSPSGLIRAVVQNLRGIPQGGSTIPQQLAKLYLRTGRRAGVLDKVEEAMFATWLVRQAAPEEVAGLYLNLSAGTSMGTVRRPAGGLYRLSLALFGLPLRRASRQDQPR